MATVKAPATPIHASLPSREGRDAEAGTEEVVAGVLATLLALLDIVLPAINRR